MRAMTWWDHETDSIWSQPWGRAIVGQLEGTRLDQIPAAIMRWSVWLADQPDTLNQSQGGNYILERWQRHGRCKHQCVGSGL